MSDITIVLKIGGAIIPSNPVFGEDLKIKQNRESEAAFLRTEIEGEVHFVGNDFDIFAQSSANTEFTLEISRDGALLGTATFLKSDCTLDFDNKDCVVKLLTSDRYEKFLDNYDNTYNLVKLSPETRSVLLNKRALLQFYMMGDSKIGIFFGNVSFEVDAQNDAASKTSLQLQTTYHFSPVYTYFVVKVRVTSDNLDYTYTNFDWNKLKSLEGDYVGKSADGNLPEWCYRDGGGSIRLFGHPRYGFCWKFYDNQNNLIAPVRDTFPTLQCDLIMEQIQGQGYITIIDAQSPYDEIDPDLGTSEWMSRIVFCRMLSDQNVVGDNPVLLSSISNDIAPNSGNYLYVAGTSWLNIDTKVVASAARTNTPNPYPDGNGQYFAVPQASAGQKMFPISPSTWGDMSFWLVGSSALYSPLDASCSVRFTLRDAYPLHSVISRLLEQVAPGVTFGNTSAYSEFLYGTTGLSQALPTPAQRASSLYITPVTNVKKTRYEQPAQKGDMTLKQVLDMLRNVYQLYWFIDNNNRLRIEHITYFKGGHMYIVGSPLADVDVTAMGDLPNGKKWTFGTNSLVYQRSKCPSRYEFSWGDASTEQFNGEPIDIQDASADGAKKEKISVSNFIADVDYAIINPQGISDDIFVLMEAKSTGNVEIASLTDFDGANCALQNGYCSFLYAERAYWPYDLGGWVAKVGNQSLAVKDTRRFAQQRISIPLHKTGVDIYGLLTAKTEIGVGTIENMDTNVDTMLADTTLVHPAEKDYVDDLDIINSDTWAIINASNANLLVGFVHNGVFHTQVCPAGAITETGCALEYEIELKFATPTGNTIIGDAIFRAGGRMSFGLNAVGDVDSFSCIMDGNEYSGGADFGYVALRIAKDTTIRLIASCEEGFDYGYVSKCPIGEPTRVPTDSNVLAHVTGEEEKTINLSAGQIVYLGYTKDGSFTGYNDTITFDIG